MNRDNEVHSELIDLGAATAETKGPIGVFYDELAGQETPGLSMD